MPDFPTNSAPRLTSRCRTSSTFRSTRPGGASSCRRPAFASPIIRRTRSTACSSSVFLIARRTEHRRWCRLRHHGAEGRRARRRGRRRDRAMARSSQPAAGIECGSRARRDARCEGAGHRRELQCRGADGIGGEAQSSRARRSGIRGRVIGAVRSSSIRVKNRYAIAHEEIQRATAARR